MDQMPSTSTLIQQVVNLLVPLALAIYQTAGRTIETGNQGLKFTLGQAVRVCEPGFYPLIPYFQTMREVPARARTLDPPTQRVATQGGFVYDVDANLTWRIVDIRKALIEVKDLERALRDLFAMGVQDVVAGATPEEIRHPEVLDGRLSRRLALQSERWGVQVEEAGFVTLAPTAETLRITQLRSVVEARAAAHGRLTSGGMPPTAALGALGIRRRLVLLSRQRRSLEHVARWRRERLVTRARLTRPPEVSWWVRLTRWLFGSATSTVTGSDALSWLTSAATNPSASR